MENNNEVWIPIKGYEGSYEVSNKGRIRSVDRIIKDRWGYRATKGKVLKLKVSKVGYIQAGLTNQKVKWKLVHRLVAIAFIPNPDNKAQVNHKDGNKQNNNDWNLEWNTPGENQIHAYANGYKCQNGEKNHRHKLNDEAIIQIRKIWAEGNTTHQKIADTYKVSRENISMILRNETWTHVK